MFFPHPQHGRGVCKERCYRKGVLLSTAFRPRGHVVPAASAVPVLPLLTSAQSHLNLRLPHSRAGRSQSARSGSPSPFLFPVLDTANRRCPMLPLPGALPHHIPPEAELCAPSLCSYSTLYVSQSSHWSSTLSWQSALQVFVCLMLTEALCRKCRCGHRHRRQDTAQHGG